MASWFRLISVRISPFCELARWVLERQGIAYEESCHVPILNVPFTKAAGGGINVPFVRAPDAAFEVHEFLNYIEARARADEKLFPTDPGERREAEDLVRSILEELAIAVRLYAYSHMLPIRHVTGKLMASHAPWWERAYVTLCYPIQARLMRNALKIDPGSTEQARKTILSLFESLSKRIPSDNAFLIGDRLSVADLVFASATAPITLPAEYGAPFPKLSDLPGEMKTTVDAVRKTAAGRLALRIYRDHRSPRHRFEETSGSAGESRAVALSRWLQRTLATPGLLRPAAAVLRLKPVWRLGKTTLITRYDEIVKTLRADQEFTIAEVNAARMNRISGPFILGMDRSEEYDRESTAIRTVVKPDDLDWIRRIVGGTAQSIIEAARQYGRLDVAGSYARVSAARVVAEYFGVPGPSEHILMQWIRSLFWDVFLNRNDEPLVRRAADRSARELRDYLTALIGQRAGEGAAGNDVLSRLVRGGALDHEGIRRNITGIIVGAIETTVTAAANAFTVLLASPAALEQTRRAAESADLAPVRQCVYEAMRFRPQAPLLVRHSKRDGRTVIAMTLSGMFDARAFPEPGRFLADRPLEKYLHFGHGMHTCYGLMINGVQLPELVRAVVQLPNVRRATGRFRKTIYEGPFPDRLVVEFGG